MMIRRYLALLTLLACSGALSSAQAPGTVVPFKTVVADKVLQIFNYRPGATTKMGFKANDIMAGAEGSAKVSSKRGAIQIEAEFKRLSRPTDFGLEYLTYVLWAVTPDGRTKNLGEVALDGNKGRVKATTSMQAFGLIVTAEPYFSVTVPSGIVIMEGVPRQGTVGNISTVSVKFEAVRLGHYSAAGLRRYDPASKVPLDLYQARNAVRIAEVQGAFQYAPDVFKKAQKTLEQAEVYQERKGNNRKAVIMTAREAVQTAEDARVLTRKRIEEEALSKERAAAAEREAVAKLKAAREAKDRAEAEAARRAAEEARQTALVQQERAEREAQNAQREAERARQAEAEAQKLREQAELAKQKAEADRRQLRATLLNQFNAVLETRDTPRGLVVNMGDVLFDTGKYDLRPAAREALAKLSGIVLSHPGLKLEIEGHTDSTGTPEFNLTLSERRAQMVRMYLASQGLPEGAITAKGFGQTMPAASNDTAKGRQLNRRVEIIVSGEVIGTKLDEALR